MNVSSHQVALVRAFNRDYTRRIGVLHEALLDSSYSLTEVRVMYEIAHRQGATAAELAADLELDRGYLSRILKRFTTQGLLAQTASAQDGRRRHLQLTEAGRRCFADLDEKSRRQVEQMLTRLDEPRRQVVLSGMQMVQTALAAQPSPSEVTLRSHRPGDMGWVVARHGELYFQEYGWDERFEALVARITAEFIDNPRPGRERCWIAERDGRRLGCIFLVSGEKADDPARLRLLLVEPEARGLGLGRRLVSECVTFARAAGYRRIVLWTQENLSAARHLYQQAGFTRTGSQPHHSFGQALVAETWELELRKGPEPADPPA